MKALSKLLRVCAIALSEVMCFSVGFYYRDMICGVEHCGYSAPTWVVFLYAIPVVVIVFIMLAVAVIIDSRHKE